MSEERTIFIPSIGECIFQLDENLNPIGMYRDRQEVEDNSKEFDWVDDEDEQDLCNKNNYIESHNLLYLHAKHLDFVKRIWAYCEFHELV